MSELLYQKIGIAVNLLAQDLLSRKVGDRIPSISEYQQLLGVSRGTVQNSLAYLKDNGAITLVSRGHMGTFIETLNVRRLQECSFNKELLGAMPLPYSACYQGLATALFQAFEPLAFNLIYARGAESRLRLIESGVCQFYECSRYAAEQAIESGEEVEIVADLGPGTYLSRHVLVLRDPDAKQITSGMRVAYDRASVDHRNITKMICDHIPDVHLVQMRAHQIVHSIRSGLIDAGVWNLDEIVESGYQGLNVVPLDGIVDVSRFSSAVVVVRKGEPALGQVLRQCLDVQKIRRIQEDVRQGTIGADY